MVFSIFITKYIVANFVSPNEEFYSTPKWDGIGSLVSPYQKQDFLVKCTDQKLLRVSMKQTASGQ